MFIIRRKDVLPSLDKKPKEAIPTILYGYGGFNKVIGPSFRTSRLMFLHNMRGMLVVASIRGGGEYGEGWHKSATKA
jgi:prolyl oligopeptidase